MRYTKMLVTRVSPEFFDLLIGISKNKGDRKLSDTIRSLLEESIKRLETTLPK